MTETTKKELKRKKLLDQGVSMLIANGYHGMGLQELLSEAQIPKGSFYAYFGSKEAFCTKVVEHYIEPVIEQLQQCIRHSEFDGLAALKHHLNTLIDMYEANEFKGGCLLGNLAGEIVGNSEAIRFALQRALNRYQNLFEEALSLAQQKGLVRRDLSTELMAELCVNSWQGALLRMQVEQSTAPLKHCRDSLLDDYFRN